MLTLFAVYMAVVISPGPNFVVVSRTSLSGSHRAGLGAAFGIATGAMAYASIAMFGLSAVLHALPRLLGVTRIIGGTFLIYVAACVLRDATKAEDQHAHVVPSGTEFLSGYRLGLVTSLSNLKAVAFFLSIFTSFIPPHASFAMRLTALAGCCGIEVGWYALVATVFSRGGLRTFYQRYGTQLDIILAAFLAALGAFSVYEGFGHPSA